eukprot:518133-Amphidinium_carterae.1
MLIRVSISRYLRFALTDFTEICTNRDSLVHFSDVFLDAPEVKAAERSSLIEKHFNTAKKELVKHMTVGFLPQTRAQVRFFLCRKTRLVDTTVRTIIMLDWRNGRHVVGEAQPSAICTRHLFKPRLAQRLRLVPLALVEMPGQE